jgi:iron complex outermembrane receptor protein
MNRTVNEDHNTLAPSVMTDFPLSTLFSPYAAASQVFTPGQGFYLVPSAGIRGYVHSLWENSLSPQAGLVAGWNNLELSLSYARGIIYPAPATIQGLINAGDFDAGELKRARPETVHHFEGGVSYTGPSQTSLSAAYFYDDGRDRIVAAGPAVPGNVSSVAYFKVQGLELGAAASLAGDWPMLQGITIFAGSTWITGVRAKGDDGKEVTRMPYTPVFSMSAGFKWDFLAGFRLGGDYQFLYDLYGGNLPRTASFAELSEAQRLEDIQLLNLRLAYTFAYKNWRLDSGEIFVAASNLLNRRYEFYRGNEMPGITLTLGGSLRFK